MVRASLVAPPFTRKWSNSKGKRLNVSEIRKTKTIAWLRIHVERAIQRVKTFRILQHQIRHTLKDVSSMLVQLVAALCNLKGPLFYGTECSAECSASRIHVERIMQRIKVYHILGGDLRLSMKSTCLLSARLHGCMWRESCKGSKCTIS